MTKFKNKKSGQVIEENLIYYVDKLKKSNNFEELEDVKSSSPKKVVTKEVEKKQLQ